MKIVTNVLESIVNVQIYPIIGLLIFLLFFVVMIYRVIRFDKSEIDEISRLPLDKDDRSESFTTNHQS